MFERSSGILLHPTSLPGKYGIGTLGKEAFAFVDFLKKSNQKLWQIFPLGPTGYGDSPYQSFSTFAGNPYLIDFDLLIEENLLSQSDLEGISFGENPESVDYGAIYNQKYPLLRKAYENYKNTKENKEREELKYLFEEFKAHNQSWLNDFAMYISLMDCLGMSGQKILNLDNMTQWVNIMKLLKKKLNIKNSLNFYSSNNGML